MVQCVASVIICPTTPACLFHLGAVGEEGGGGHGGMGQCKGGLVSASRQVQRVRQGPAGSGGGAGGACAPMHIGESLFNRHGERQVAGMVQVRGVEH